MPARATVIAKHVDSPVVAMRAYTYTGGAPGYVVDLMPSDYTAEVLYRLFIAHFAPGQTFHLTAGAAKSYIVAGASPNGDLVGGINVYSRIELFGQDADAMWLFVREENWNLAALVGGRFLQMRERLDLTATSRVLPDQSVLIGLTDHFHTFDKFFGIQTGLAAEARLFDRLSVSARGTVALGVDDQIIRIQGDRVFHTPLARTTQDFGLFALPSNRGSHERGAFDTVWDTSFSLSYEMTRHLTLRGGYSLLVWNNPVRPGDQITPVNLSQVAPGGLVGPAEPHVPWKSDLFWAHGANIGLELRW